MSLNSILLGHTTQPEHFVTTDKASPDTIIPLQHHYAVIVIDTSSPQRHTSSDSKGNNQMRKLRSMANLYVVPIAGKGTLYAAAGAPTPLFTRLIEWRSLEFSSRTLEGFF